MKIACLVLATTIGSVSAFAPTTRPRFNTVSFSSEVADDIIAEVVPEPAVEAPAPVSAPVSDAFCLGYVGGEGPEPMPFTVGTSSVNFDPLKFTERAPEWIPWFREAELKHGRAAMLATVGFIIPEMMRIPGEQFSFASVPKVIDAHDALPESMLQIILWISLLEAMTFPALANMNEFDRRPGDFSFDPLGLYPTTEEKQREMQLMELKNGRLAMMAIGGMVAGAAISGQSFPYLPEIS